MGSRDTENCTGMPTTRWQRSPLSKRERSTFRIFATIDFFVFKERVRSETTMVRKRWVFSKIENGRRIGGLVARFL